MHKWKLRPLPWEMMDTRVTGPILLAVLLLDVVLLQAMRCLGRRGREQQLVGVVEQQLRGSDGDGVADLTAKVFDVK